MVTPHGIQLAVHLISCSYGDLCSKVCECLLRRGNLNLAQLIQFTELCRENVINCLRVLIHQNCVQAFAVEQEGAFGETSKIVTQYVALFENMIHKLRAPKFLQIVSEELGTDCLGIFQGLLQHGRLSLSQIIDRNQQTTEFLDVQSVEESFTKLLNSRFVERCPAPEPVVSPPSEDEIAARKQTAKLAKTAEEPMTPEQRALAAASPSEGMRFLLEIDKFAEKKVEKCSKRGTAGEKRKYDALRSEKDIFEANKKKEILWRVNYEELVSCLRHKACISYANTNIDHESGIVLSAILELSRVAKNAQKAEKSAYLSMKVIYDEVIKKGDGVDLDFEHVRVSLDQLGCQTISTEADESYSVDLKGIIEMAQNEEVESAVLSRHGREAYKIFRLLSKADRLVETDKISDATFIRKNEMIKILYKMWKDNYLHMEKVMVTGAKQSPFMLWKVNKQPLEEHILDELYHAALNLRLKITHEQNHGKEVLQLPKEKLVGELEKKYNRLVKVRMLLESSLMNLDDTIMLFHDF